MGVMKRLNQWHRVDSGHLVQWLRVLGGLEPPPPPELTKEEKAELRAAKKEAEAERAAIQAVEAEAEEARRAARLAEWRAEAGPPMAPQNPTGWYLCAKLDRAFFPVGQGPWPDYRPPGLGSGLEANQARGRPRADEVPPPKVWAADPKPVREAAGKVQQGRLF